MRVPMGWLREHAAVPADATAAGVAADLVRVGLEEEAVHGGDVTGPLVVGRVLEVTPEPQRNGKTIRWCQVDVGEPAPRGIVCGAANVTVGALVVVALPGAVLPGGFAISARKTYGHVSDGMICSERELGLGEDHAGIIVLGERAASGAVDLDGVGPGADAIALLGLDEEVVEVNVTPDRGYCLSVRGVAREYGHATGAAFVDPALALDPGPAASAGSATAAAAAPAEGGASGPAVRLVDDYPLRGRAGCDRFVARVVRSVDPAAPSPAWLQRRLTLAGMRPISLVVDVTNYVMLDLGQPMHAYDLGLLSGPITVRRARAGEKLRTLDDVERSLDSEDLLITDTGDTGERVLGLAGVMGGAEVEVSASTTDVLLEAAHFDQVTVFRTARRHRLSTEASRRFERGVDHDLPPRAAELAVRLLAEHGGGVPDGAWTDVDERFPVASLTMPADLPARLVGVPYSTAEVVASLRDVGCQVVEQARATTGAGAPDRGRADAEVLAVTAPSWRPDLVGPAHLVEEVARLRGYGDIPDVVPVPPPGRGLTRMQRARRAARDALVADGYVEVLSYPFVPADGHDRLGLPPDDVRRRATRLRNPLREEEPELRTALLPTLLETARRNVARGEIDLAVVELGMVTRPEPGAGPAGIPGVAGRPDGAELASVDAAIPPQPQHLAVVLAGQRELAGWAGPGRPADWTDAVEAVRTVAAALGVADLVRVRADERAPWHPGRCAAVLLRAGAGAYGAGGDGAGGVGAEGDGGDGGDGEERLVGHAGELHPGVLAALGLPPRASAAEVDLDALVAAGGRRVVSAPLSRHPLAKEDVAVVVPQDVPVADVERALAAGAGPLLESIRLFDVYTGDQVPAGRRSLAFALRFRAADRTLTAAETAAARDAAVAEAGRAVGAVLRT